MKRALRVLLCIGGLFSVSAFGQVMTYTFSGNANGNVNGTAFTSQSFSLVVTGLRSTVANAADPASNVLTSGVITISGTACAGGCPLTAPAGLVVWAFRSGAFVHGISTVGNVDVAGQTVLEACFNCGGTTIPNDLLVQNIASTTAGAANALAPYLAFATSAGPVNITLLNSVAFASSVNAVPTLSEWSLIILAGLLGVFGFWRLGRPSPEAA